MSAISSIRVSTICSALTVEEKKIRSEPRSEYENE